MKIRHNWLSTAAAGAALAAAVLVHSNNIASAQGAGPEMLDQRLGVRPFASGLTLPIALAFPSPNFAFVLEKNSGQVKRVTNGQVMDVVLDLAVNNSSERGLLGIALHPQFPSNPGVYLYWTCRSTAPPTDPFFPDERTCLDANMFAADSSNILQVPLLGNRVDRFVWDGSALVYERNLIMLRAFQNDGAPTPQGQGDQAQPPRGNHNAGVLRFGPDGKLYVQMGDNGRRGWMQNLIDGPGPGQFDDQFGGPEPDDAHLTGVILRLNDDGSAPVDNPFFRVNVSASAEVRANIQKIYAYGIRNGFGMAFDPLSGALWEQENGDDSFSEINRADAGFNSGWVQIMGPPNRLAQYKTIETTVTPSPPDPFAATYFGLQQLRWSPENIADTPQEALARLFMLPGAHYSAPELAWKFEVAPGGIGFVRGQRLGPEFEGNLFVAGARDLLEGGHLFRLRLTADRRAVAVDDPRLQDRVADNRHKWEITESESLLIGRNFGVGTDVQTGPNGNLYVVSLSHGAIYEIFRKQQ
jgi:glucose/arabinose dehydrogenase